MKVKAWPRIAKGRRRRRCESSGGIKLIRLVYTLVWNLNSYLRKFSVYLCILLIWWMSMLNYGIELIIILFLNVLNMFWVLDINWWSKLKRKEKLGINMNFEKIGLIWKILKTSRLICKYLKILGLYVNYYGIRTYIWLFEEIGA